MFSLSVCTVQMSMQFDTREFTKPRFRRQGKRRLKINLYFTYESRDTLKSFTLFITVKTFADKNLKYQPSWCTFSRQHKILVISRCRCRGRRRNVTKIITHVYSYCSAHEFFCSMTFPLPFSSWFRKLPSAVSTTRYPG